MKNLLIIFIVAMMFAACSDNVYEKNNSGMVVRCKELRKSVDVTYKQPWLYEYNIIDFSSKSGNVAGNRGDFYYYSSSNFFVGDTLTFTTKALLREMHTNVKKISTLEKNLLTFISTKALADSLQNTVEYTTAFNDSLLTQLSINRVNLQKARQINTKNIKLQADLITAQAKISKLKTFKNSLKALIKK